MSDNLALAEGHEMLAALGIQPAYVVTMDTTRFPFSDAEWRYVHEHHAGARGFTSPVADVMLKNALRYDWKGRGCCIVLCVSPQGLSRVERLGLILHEAAHYVADCDQPARDDVDHVRAVQAFWGSLRSTEDPHGERWLRALVHLWVRADAMGFPLGLGDTMDPEFHPCKPEQLLPLLKEADDRAGESIESILATPLPGATATVTTTTMSTEPRKRRRVRFGTSPGGFTEFHPDGSCETFASLDGTSPALRFPTYAALCEHFEPVGAA
jgi:hypothetical protein